MWDDQLIYGLQVVEWWNGYAGNERGDDDGLPLFGLLADIADVVFRLNIAASSSGESVALHNCKRAS